MTETATETKPPRQMLSHKQLIKVADYIRANDVFLQGRSAESITAQIANGTRIELTRAQLLGLQKTLELDWLVPSNKAKVVTTDAGLRTLANAVRLLFAAQDMVAPDEVRALADADLFDTTD